MRVILHQLQNDTTYVFRVICNSPDAGKVNCSAARQHCVTQSAFEV